jgi:Flp pilus assembly protein TadG
MAVACLKRFLRDSGGNVGIILALVSVPLVGSAGIAIDYVNRNQAEARVQAAVDAGALAGAAMQNASESKIRQAIKEFAKANGVDAFTNNPSALSIDISPDGAITVEARGEVPTTLSSVLGFDKLEFGARAQARRGDNAAEITLVLDNTKSMEDGGKIDTLRNAALNFVDTLSHLNDAGDPDRIRISVVPYAQYVNVGLGNRNASWMDVEPDISITWRNCRIPGSEHLEERTFERDGVTVTENVTVYDYYTNDADCSDETYVRKWEGCAGSREYPYNVNDTRLDIRFAGPRHAFCPTPITPLTSNRTDLENAINALDTNIYQDINTYIPAGLSWGWRVLSDGVPFSDGVSQADAARDGVTKHMLLMTDGVNTVAKNTLPNNSFFIRDTTTHEDTDAEWQARNARTGAGAGADADQITAELCENIKAAGITVYTVAFQVNDATTQDLLRNCASSPANYYDAGDAAKLTSSFEAIAAKVASVRLSK